MTRKNSRRKGATRKRRYKTGGAEDSDPDDEDQWINVKLLILATFTISLVLGFSKA